jgi:hypothetical protein
VSAENLFEGIPLGLPDELSEEIVRGEGVRIERIVSLGRMQSAIRCGSRSSIGRVMRAVIPHDSAALRA